MGCGIGHRVNIWVEAEPPFSATVPFLVAILLRAAVLQYFQLGGARLAEVLFQRLVHMGLELLVVEVHRGRWVEALFGGQPAVPQG